MKELIQGLMAIILFALVIGQLDRLHLFARHEVAKTLKPQSWHSQSFFR